jgi:hypothetical protein
MKMVESSEPLAKDHACPAEPGAGGHWTPRLSRAGWEALTNPRRIALVGASGRESSVSFTSRFLQTNDELGFTGDIFLIDPKSWAVNAGQILPHYPSPLTWLPSIFPTKKFYPLLRRRSRMAPARS